MTRDTQTELVRLEPKNRATLDAERDALIGAVMKELETEIASPAEYAGVAEIEQRLDAFIAKVEPEFDDLCGIAHKAWKKACGIRSLFLDAPKALKARARQLLGDYKAREERQRRDAERELAEQQRRDDLERQKREAALLDKQGHAELAQAVRSQPVVAPVVVLPSAVPEVEGLSFREEWTWIPVGGDTPHNRARTVALLVRPEYAQLLKLDDAGLTSFARHTKGTTRVPGIQFFSKQIPVRR